MFRFALVLLPALLAACITPPDDTARPCAHLGHIVNAPEARLIATLEGRYLRGDAPLSFLVTDASGHEDSAIPEDRGCVRFTLPYPGEFRFEARAYSAEEPFCKGELVTTVALNEVIDRSIPLPHGCTVRDL